MAQPVDKAEGRDYLAIPHTDPLLDSIPSRASLRKSTEWTIAFGTLLLVCFAHLSTNEQVAQQTSYNYLCPGPNGQKVESTGGRRRAQRSATSLRIYLACFFSQQRFTLSIEPTKSGRRIRPADRASRPPSPNTQARSCPCLPLPRRRSQCRSHPIILHRETVSWTHITAECAKRTYWMARGSATDVRPCLSTPVSKILHRDSSPPVRQVRSIHA